MILYRSLINNVIELFEHRGLGCGLVNAKRATKLRIDSAIVANEITHTENDLLNISEVAQGKTIIYSDNIYIYFR